MASSEPLVEERVAGEAEVQQAARPDPRPSDGDHERFAHYVRKDKIVESTVVGSPLMALCGKVWVPSRDPKRFPICPECQRLYDLGPQGRMREWAERAAEG